MSKQGLQQLLRAAVVCAAQHSRQVTAQQLAGVARPGGAWWAQPQLQPGSCRAFATTTEAAIAAEAARHANHSAQQKAQTTVWGIIKRVVTNRAVLLLAGAGFLFTADVSVERRIRDYYRRQVYERVEAGFCAALAPADSEEAAAGQLPREALKHTLRQALQAPGAKKYYAVVYGARGVGKTSAIREVLAEQQGGCGYLAVDPLPDLSLGTDLGEALNFRYTEHLGTLNVLSRLLLGGAKVADDTDPLRTLQRAARALGEAATQYYRKHGRPFTLVIDNADRLMQSSKPMLAVLQEYAKDWAEEGDVMVVFVLAESGTLKYLQGNSAWSHALAPIEVADLTCTEAAAWLRAHGVAPPAAADLAALVGGRFQRLEKCAAAVRSGVPVPVIKDQFLRMMEAEYDAAGLLSQTPQQMPGLQVVRELLRAGGCISMATWRRLVPQPDLQDILLNRANVFRARWEGLSWDSRLAEVYARDLLPQRLDQRPLREAGVMSRA